MNREIRPKEFHGITVETDTGQILYRVTCMMPDGEMVDIILLGGMMTILLPSLVPDQQDDPTEALRMMGFSPKGAALVKDYARHRGVDLDK